MVVLPGAGRPHAEDQPVRPLGDPLHLREVAVVHPQLVDGDGLVGGEDPHHHVLVPAGGGDGGHAELDLAVGEGDLDLAVLGLPALGDVQPGHDLDPRDQRPPEGAGQLHVLRQAPSTRNRMMVSFCGP